MKKVWAVLLLLCMVCTQALAIGDDIEMMDFCTREYTDEAGNLWIYAVYTVGNWGEIPTSPTHISIMLLDKNGAPMKNLYYPLYPPVIEPNGMAYAVGIFCLTPEEQQQYGSVMADFYGGTPTAKEPLPVMQTESTVEGAHAVTRITNTSGADAETVKVLHLYRNDGNEIVGAHETEVSLKTDEMVEVEHAFTFAPYESVETIAFIPAQ